MTFPKKLGICCMTATLDGFDVRIALINSFGDKLQTLMNAKRSHVETMLLVKIRWEVSVVLVQKILLETHSVLVLVRTT